MGTRPKSETGTGRKPVSLGLCRLSLYPVKKAVSNDAAVFSSCVAELGNVGGIPCGVGHNKADAFGQLYRI